MAQEVKKYTTQLSDAEEYQFRNWYNYVSPLLVWTADPNDSRSAYDIRGYWKENKYKPILPGQHFPDKYKQPTHPTFSNESIYAEEAPLAVGSWEEDLVPLKENTDNYIVPDLSDNRLRIRQQYAESKFNPNAISHTGAVGLYQIMPTTFSDYSKRTSKTGKLTDPKVSHAVRDWKMNQLLKTKAVSGTDENGEVNPLVKLCKQYAAYNWGEGNLGKFLEKQKEAGVDIYHSLDWIDSMPTEPRNYVKFIVLGKDAGGNREKEFKRNYSKHMQHGGKFQSRFRKAWGNLVYKPLLENNIDSNDNELESYKNNYSNYPIQSVTPIKIDFNPIVEEVVEQPQIQRGVTQYKDSKINPGNMKPFLDKLEEFGISVRVTSGHRPGALTSNGRRSLHADANAIDIVPIEGQTYSDLRSQIASHPELVQYMRDNGIGIIDETDPITKQKTKATGDHWHVSLGNETLAIYGRDKLFG